MYLSYCCIQVRRIVELSLVVGYVITTNFIYILWNVIYNVEAHHPLKVYLDQKLGFFSECVLTCQVKVEVPLC